MQNSEGSILDRRSFLVSAIGTSALSYARITGANDRLSLGHIGVGSRGSELHMMVSRLKDKYNVETVAVCDLWKDNRERAAANARRYYGRAPRAFQHMEDLLALKDVDAVLIATPEHSHSPVLKATAEAGKDAYCEKPMGNVLDEVKAARDAVKTSQPHRPDRNAAPQRALPAGGPGSRPRAACSATSASTKSYGTTTARAGAAAPR